MLPRQAPMSRRVRGLSDGPVGFDVTTLRRRYDGLDKAEVEERSRAEREKVIISEQARDATRVRSSKAARILSPRVAENSPTQTQRR